MKIAGCFSWRLVFGVRACFRRGNANNGANAGLSYLEIDDALSSTNAHWSSPLSCLEGVCPSKTFFEKKTLALAKKLKQKVWCW